MSTLAERRKQAPRDKKKVERFVEQPLSGINFDGEGKAIGEIPEIVAAMKGMKKASDNAVLIHKVFFGSAGSADERKKEIMKFKGLKGKTVAETEELIEKKTQYLEKQSFSDLIELCRLFCLAGASKEKTKEKYAEEIIKFLKKPGDIKVVVTEKDKVAHIEDEEEKETKKPAKKEEKKETKKPAKKEAKKEEKKSTKKTNGKKADEKKTTTTPKKGGDKKETKKDDSKKPKSTKTDKKTTTTPKKDAKATPKKDAKSKGKK